MDNALCQMFSIFLSLMSEILSSPNVCGISLLEQKTSLNFQAHTSQQKTTLSYKGADRRPNSNVGHGGLRVGGEGGGGEGVLATFAHLSKRFVIFFHFHDKKISSIKSEIGAPAPNGNPGSATVPKFDRNTRPFLFQFFFITDPIRKVMLSQLYVILSTGVGVWSERGLGVCLVRGGLLFSRRCSNFRHFPEGVDLPFSLKWETSLQYNTHPTGLHTCFYTVFEYILELIPVELTPPHLGNHRSATDYIYRKKCKLNTPCRLYGVHINM